jgi:hypothetical protein
MITDSNMSITPSLKMCESQSNEAPYAHTSRASGRRLSSSGWFPPAKTPHRPGMTVKAIIPDPSMAPTPSAASSPPSLAPMSPRCVLTALITVFIVLMALITISGAALPNAMKLAPATSSRTSHRTHRVSRLTTRWLSATMATPTNA